MKSLIKQNILLIIKNPLFLITNFIFNLIFIFSLYSSDLILEDIFIVITGSTNHYHSFAFISISLIMNFLLIIYSVIIYSSAILNNYESIFLRISRKKWLINIFISEIITIFIFLLNSLIITIIYNIFTKQIFLSKNLIEWFIIIFLNKMIIQLLLFIFIKLFKRSYYIYITILLLIPILFNRTLFLQYFYPINLINNFGYIKSFIFEIIIILILVILNIRLKEKYDIV